MGTGCVRAAWLPAHTPAFPPIEKIFYLPVLPNPCKAWGVLCFYLIHKWVAQYHSMKIKENNE
jgi:hypothetical protein